MTEETFYNVEKMILSYAQCIEWHYSSVMQLKILSVMKLQSKR
jgi:hypothetical protein